MRMQFAVALLGCALATGAQAATLPNETPGYFGIVDYDGEIEYCEYAGQNTDGLEFGSVSPATTEAAGLQQVSHDKTFYSGPSYEAGKHWYDSN